MILYLLCIVGLASTLALPVTAPCGIYFCLTVKCKMTNPDDCPNGKLVPNSGWCKCCPICDQNLTSTSAFLAPLECPKFACAAVLCLAVRPSDCPNGQIVGNTGYCGCCSSCVQDLKLGDDCKFLPGSVKGQCPKGSVCSDKTHTCVASNKRQIVTGKCVIANLKNGLKTLFGRPHHKCNPDGSFSAVQCLGSVCYCVDENNKEIKGYGQNISKLQGKNCLCAREKDAYAKTGLIGKQFSCLDNGNYSPYKCEGSVCYCSDKNGLMTGTQKVNIGLLSSLQCN